MGQIVVEIKLENTSDRHLARVGVTAEGDVRRETIRAAVDSRAMIMLALPPDVVERLGLSELDRVATISVDGRLGEAQVAGPLTAWIGDRQMTAECLVLPEGAEAVVGQLVLNVLDLHPDPVNGALNPRPESPDHPLLRV